MTDENHDAKRVVTEYAELWNEQDYSRIPHVVTESYVHEGPVAVVEGHSGLEGLMREFTTSFPDFHVDVIDVLVDDDAVAVEVRYTMTHEGEFNDIPPTGRTVDVGGMGKLLLEDGKVTEHREFHDQLEVLEQLGVLEE